MDSHKSTLHSLVLGLGVYWLLSHKVILPVLRVSETGFLDTCVCSKVEEMLIELEQCDYDLSHDNLRQLAFGTFASPAETKSTCENAFAWLKDSQRQSSAATCLLSDKGPTVIKAKRNNNYSTSFLLLPCQDFSGENE